MKVTFGNNNKPDFSQINNCPVYLEAYTGGVLRNFAKLTGKHLCQSFVFNEVEGLGLQLSSACNFIKKETLAQEFC